jgi:predicted nucleic acid-binding Zn ribbon protein
MPFTPIGDTLKDNVDSKGPLQAQVQASLVLDSAKTVLEELFGKELANHANPLFLKNRTLTISCASSAISQEIRLNQAQIVEKINSKIGKNEVDRIRYLA